MRVDFARTDSVAFTTFRIIRTKFREFRVTFTSVCIRKKKHSATFENHIRTHDNLLSFSMIHTSLFRCIQVHSVRAAFGSYFIQHHSMPTSFTIGHESHSQTASYSPDLIQSHTTSFRVDTFTLNHIRRPVTVHLQHFPHSLRASYKSTNIHPHSQRIQQKKHSFYATFNTDTPAVTYM